MNLGFFLTPVAQVVCLEAHLSVEQAVDRLREHRYTAVPLLDDEARYLGTLTSADLLAHLAEGRAGTLAEVDRSVSNQAVGIDTDVQSLFRVVVDQNFVPVVDSRGVLMGIVTRKAILTHFERLLSEHGLLATP